MGFMIWFDSIGITGVGFIVDIVPAMGGRCRAGEIVGRALLTVLLSESLAMLLLLASNQ